MQLRNFQTDFPDWGSKKQVEIGDQPVDVDDIIGGNITVASNFNDDWTPKYRDNRYKKVLKFVGNTMKGRKRDYINLNWIHLFQFYSDELEKTVYYVCDNGHNRVSAAKELGVETIMADVTWITIR